MHRSVLFLTSSVYLLFTRVSLLLRSITYTESKRASNVASNCPLLTWETVTMARVMKNRQNIQFERNSFEERVRGIKISPMPKKTSTISRVKMIPAKIRMWLKRKSIALRTLLFFLLIISILLRFKNNLAIYLKTSLTLHLIPLWDFTRTKCGTFSLKDTLYTGFWRFFDSRNHSGWLSAWYYKLFSSFKI